MKYFLDDPRLGRVYILVRPQARRLIARWKDGHVNLTIPADLSAERVCNFLKENAEKIAAMPRHEVQYWVGQEIQCWNCSVVIGEQRVLPNRLVFGHEGSRLYLNVPQGIDMNNEGVKRSISATLQALMSDKAQELLLPYAHNVASRVEVKPQGFEVGRGMKKLGHCTRGGVIQLSRNVMFLPAELVDLIICHELAHLTHFNHSPQFHELVNQYLGGREKELERKLKSFRWPIVG